MSTYAGLTLSDTTYAGEVASSFIRAAIVDAQTINGGHVYVKDGIKKKFTIPRISVADMIQDYSVKPSSSGTTTIDASVLEPSTYQLYCEFDPHDFEDHWYSQEMQKNLVDRNLPSTVEAAIVSAVLEYHADYFDKALWQNALTGSTPYNKFDGFIQKAKADSTVLDVTTTATALTASNIVTELEKTYAKIPAAILYNPNLKIFVSYATAEYYSNYQIAQTNKGVDVSQRGAMTYKGVKIVALANFPDGKMVAAVGSADMKSNLWVGVNSTDDNSVTLGKVQANSEARFIKVLFKADTAFGFGKEVVLYQLA